MLSYVNKFFELEEKKELNLLFLTFLGPLFLLTSLFLTSFTEVANKDLFLHSVVGVFLCWKQKQKGLILSLLFLIILVFIKHFQISYHVLQFGIEISIALGFIISFFCFEHIKEYLSNEKKQFVDSKKDIEEMKLELNKEKDFYERQYKNFKYEKDRIAVQLEEKKTEIDSFKSLVEKLREKEILYQKEKKETLEKLNIKEKEFLDLKNENSDLHNLKEKLIEVEKEKEKSYVINQNLSKMLLKEKEIRKKLENEKDSPKNSFDANHIHSLYKQLKTQFEEKKQVLDAARKELFHTKEQLLALQKEREKDAIEESDLQKELKEEIFSLSEENKRYEEENKNLQSLVNTLNKKLIEK